MGALCQPVGTRRKARSRYTSIEDIIRKYTLNVCTAPSHFTQVLFSDHLLSLKLVSLDKGGLIIGLHLHFTMMRESRVSAGMVHMIIIKTGD
jgi:hypothetical protein